VVQPLPEPGGLIPDVLTRERTLPMLDTVTCIDQTVRELHAQVPVLRF
jgi:hypothetical protein